MRDTRSFCCVALGTMLWFVPALCGQESKPSAGEVQLRVVGPDGKIVPHQTIELRGPEFVPGDPARTPPPLKTQTDEHGVATFAWPVGRSQIQVSCEAVGYGITDQVEVVAGKTVQVELLPLAPLATISGTVVDGDGTELSMWSPYLAQPPKLAIGKDGRFTVHVRGGPWGFQAWRGKKVVGASDHTISVAPGAVVRDVIVRKLSADEQKRANEEYEAPAEQVPADQDTITWAEGTIRDVHGAPMVGATVYAVASDLYGACFRSNVNKTTTDEKGHYEIKGEGNLESFSATLVAWKQGWAPAISWTPHRSREYIDVPRGATTQSVKREPVPAPVQDMVMEKLGGGFEVKVIRDGKAVPGIFVSLCLAGGNLRDHPSLGGGEAAEIEVQKIVEPRAATDAAGVAHFERLLPGEYTITVSSDEDLVSNPGNRFIDDKQPDASIDHVYVRAGALLRQTVTIYPVNRTVRFDIAPGPGVALSGNMPVRWGRVNGGLLRGYPGPVAGKVAEWMFAEPGLHHIEFGVGKAWDGGEPFDAAVTTAAISPRLANAQPIHVTTLHFEAPSATVQLLDRDGKPMAGVVQVGFMSVGEPSVVASTDGKGRIAFPHVPSGRRIYARGWVVGSQPISMDSGMEFKPADDSAFVGREFIPVENTFLGPNEHADLVLRSRPAGFVRGFVHPPPGMRTDEFFMSIGSNEFEHGAGVEYRRSTGEFTAGPFLAGKVTFGLEHALGKPRTYFTVSQDAVAVAGKLIHMDITVAAPRSYGTENALLIGAGGQVSLGMGEQDMKGHVYLRDGKTPAFGARILYYRPGQPFAQVVGMTDAGGNIHGQGVYYGNSGLGEAQPPGPDHALIVASLPGRLGATIVDPPADPRGGLSIRLASGIQIKGTITVGGKVLDGSPGRIRVLAKFQGKGFTGDAMDVWAVPQADGTFTLPGLTPGDM